MGGRSVGLLGAFALLVNDEGAVEDLDHSGLVCGPPGEGCDGEVVGQCCGELQSVESFGRHERWGSSRVGRLQRNCTDLGGEVDAEVLPGGFVVGRAVMTVALGCHLPHVHEHVPSPWSARTSPSVSTVPAISSRNASSLVRCAVAPGGRSVVISRDLSRAVSVAGSRLGSPHMGHCGTRVVAAKCK